MPRRSSRASPFDDLDTPSEVVASAEPVGVPDGARPLPRRPPEALPGLAWRLSGPLVALVALFVFVSLASYHASDVPFLHSPQPSVPHNWTGLAGANLGWALLQVFGLPAFAVPVALFAAGVAMTCGVRMGWRPLWAAGLLPCLCALFQRAEALFSPLLSSPRFNLGGDAGGGVGWLLHHAGSTAEQWIGPVGETVLTVAATLLFLVLLVGPRSVAARFRDAARRRAEIRRAAEERAFGGTSAVEDDEDRRAVERDERRAAKAAAKAEREAERERRRAEKEAAAAEREAARERLRAEREAARAEEKARREAEREEEKARREAEKAAAKKRSREDALFGAEDPAPEDAPEESPDPVAEDPSAPVPSSASSTRASAFAPSAAVPSIPVASAPAPSAAVPSVPSVPLVPVEPSPPPPADPLAWESDPAAGDFELPSVRLLKPVPPETAEDNRAEIEERSRIIEDTLGQFGLKVEVVDVVCGPTITRYEVRPAPGVRVDRISTYEHDLQMSLRAKSIRIISPIPGKDVLGIEVPNRHRRAVPFRGIAETPEWKAAEQRMGIPMLLGKDIDGSPVIADLAKMPHLIVAGATGSGKSVGLNSILSGILLCRTPAQVRMILVDPKMVEFTPYADIPHLVVPVITEAPKVAVALQWAIKEMNRRLQLFKSVGVRNIVSYNTRPLERQATLFGDDESGAAPSAPPAHIPYIVIVVDEMSDLMMLAGGDVEPRVVRLAQLARAVGIHLVIATQRPDVKTITGKIKANFPARLAFKVVSQVDSITILNSAGAETLIGNGDMLFMNPTSAAGAARAQGCWIDDDEIAALTGWYRNQGPPVYVPEIKEKLDRIKVKDAGGDDIKGIEDPGAPEEDGGAPRTGEEADLARALAVIVSSGRATISWVQRQLKVGYNRAARIIEELEERGCIGPANGTAPREILRTTLGPPPGSGDDDATDGDDADGDGDFV